MIAVLPLCFSDKIHSANTQLDSYMNTFFSYVKYSLIGFQSNYKLKYIVIYEGDVQDKEMLSLLGYFSTSTSTNIAMYIAVGLLFFFSFSVFRAVVKFLSIFNKLQR